MVTANPGLAADPPKVKPRQLDVPSMAQVRSVQQKATKEFAAFIQLAATVGARRGTLIALRWGDTDLDRSTITFARAIAESKDGPVEKGTKSERTYTVRLGPDTKDVLTEHKRRAEERATVVDVPFRKDSFVFSDDGGVGHWHNALRLGREELGPRWALSSRSRWETVAAQHGPATRLRHADAELLQLADDAEIAPPGVLPCQVADQLDGLLRKDRTTWPAMRVVPAPPDQRAVPTQDRFRADEERPPAFPRHKAGQEGDEGPVGPGEVGTGDLAVQHGQLVAEHEDLRLLGRGIHPMDANNLNDAPDETVEEGQGHDRQASSSVLWLVNLGQGVSGPFNPQDQSSRCCR
jgi:hypothetical protein